MMYKDMIPENHRIYNQIEHTQGFFEPFFILSAVSMQSSISLTN